jgi:uncharacterized lipoprotein YmbA
VIRHPRRPRAAAWAVAAAILAASCVFRRGADPTRFWVLPATVEDPALPGTPLAIGLGPIVLPGYLQHSELATRVGTEVRYASVDRWAEPLPTLFGRALGRDLSALLHARIVPYPWYRMTALDVLVRVDVASFEADAAGNARLEACWSIRSAPTKALCREECSSIADTAEGRGPAAQVAALGAAVGELARRTSAAIASCPRPER